MTEINWPVFQLANKPPSTEDGVTFYKTESYNKDTNTYKTNIRIIDDKNLTGKSFGLRRLQLKQKGILMYNIRKTVYFIGDFIKLATPKMWFIDSSGKIFQYKKTTRAKLQFYKVKNIFPVGGIGAVIEVEGIPQRFKVLFRPIDNNNWAGILEIDKLKFLYGLYDKQHEETWRLI